MREVYLYANLVDNMYLDGDIFRRCGICRCHPVPREAAFVLWCNPCFDAFDNRPSGQSLDEFLESRRTIPRGFDKISRTQ
jgi:hypothetical protein